MMHPKLDFPGKLKPIFEDLATPMHARSHRNPERLCREGEVSLEAGFRLDLSAFEGEPHLGLLLDDFRTFMTTVMETAEAADGYAIRVRRERPATSPKGAREAHRLAIAEDGCLIQAEDMDALRRALYRLQDEMLLRRAPVLPVGDETRWTTIATRIIRSPIAPYRWWSGWELDDDPNDYYPDAYLNRLAHAGINGLWIPGLLRKLVASTCIPELGPREHRLEKLKAVVAKAARYGIRIYLFCIEPRALPKGHPALVAHPEITGAGNTLCSSQPLVREYIREVMQSLFTEVPELAGIINIFCGERPTTCYWRDEEFAAQCPTCSQRSQGEVLAESLNAFMDGIRAAGSQADVMAWTYFIGKNREASPIAPMLEVMKRTDPRVIWLGNFEHGGEKELCGKQVRIHEYSLSYLGPSSDFVAMAKAAIESGRTIHAKLQIGTSYELSSVPYIPAPGIEYEKIRIATELGVTGSMMTWIPGGFPSPMLKAAGEAVFEPRLPHDAFLRRIAAIYWGEATAAGVAASWKIFDEAWQRYPFAHAGLYWGPITRGPAYQLHLEREARLAKPYNFGFTRKREPQPWEDNISRWLGPFTPDELAGAFRDMAERWQGGLAKLDAARELAGADSELDRQVAVAAAIRLHAVSAANVFEFYSLRDSLLEAAPSDHPAIVARMSAVARDDVQAAKAMLELLAREPRLGFETEIFDYSYTRPLLAEKILQVQEMLPILARWEANGIEPEILRRTVEEADLLRPDRDPDRWGD